MKDKLKQYAGEVANFTADEIISWGIKQFGKERIILSSSLSLEDQVITDMLLRHEKDARILVLDTGRNFQETYDVMQRTMDKFRIRYEVYSPESADIEELVNIQGPNLFYESVENRKLCCEIRKVRPLRRALSTADAWITGLRREQSVTRTLVEPVEWDDNFGIFKLNPLYKWDMKQVKKYIKENEVPYNTLSDRGYLSIGCAPCTRAVHDGEDERAGRWWWETPEKRECGLHIKNSGGNSRG
jgi:phosphoadenosine phosphosulfate reductase